MQGEQILSALIGLVGAVSNNGKTERTDDIVRNALKQMKNGEEDGDLVEKIHREKFAVSPDCAVCKNPCGNTSDYDMRVFHEEDETIRHCKTELMKAVCQDPAVEAEGPLPDLVYQGIAYFGLELDEASYNQLTKHLKDFRG